MTGFTAPEKWPDALTRKWSTPVGLGAATPALVGDKLYVFVRQGADEVTLCLNAGNGDELWQDKYAAQEVTGAAGRHPGPRSSPTVADGKVVTMGVGGVLSCLNAATGKLAWRKDPFPEIVPSYFTSMSPIIVDGMAVAHFGGKDNGAIIAFDLSSGDLKWRWTSEGPGYASPVLMTVDQTKQIVTVTEKSVLGIGVADGMLLWQLPFAPQGRGHNSATPIVDGQTVIYTGAGRGAKAVRIEKQADGFDAKELWSNENLGAGFNTPVLKDGFLFGLTERGSFYCMNARTGQEAWIDAARRDRFGATLDAGSVILALSGESELIAYKSDPRPVQRDRPICRCRNAHLRPSHHRRQPPLCQKPGVRGDVDGQLRSAGAENAKTPVRCYG